MAEEKEGGGKEIGQVRAILVPMSDTTLDECLKQKGYSAIPLRETIAGHLELKVTLSNTEVFFLLDTGAGNTVIDIEFARDNNLNPTELETKGGGVGTSELQIFQLRIDELTLDNFLVKDIPIYAVDLTHVKQSLLAKGETNLPVGVIGADILRQHRAVIDYAADKLYLMANV